MFALRSFILITCLLGITPRICSLSKTHVAACAVGGYLYLRHKQAKAHRLAVETFNAETLKTTKIDAETELLWDLHGVVANYNIPRMLTHAAKNWRICATLFTKYPRMLPSMIHSIYEGKGAQEVLEAAQRLYPNDRGVTALFNIGMEISAQLYPVVGTQVLMGQLSDMKQPLRFASNIETDGFNRFKRDFPQFAEMHRTEGQGHEIPKYPHYVVGEENNWRKKPDQTYFEDLQQKHPWGQRLFIDDKLVNCQAALKAGIPAYVFTTPEKLREDLGTMGLAIAPRPRPQA